MKQPTFVRNFFSIPLGKINKIDKKIDDIRNNSKYN